MKKALAFSLFLAFLAAQNCGWVCAFSGNRALDHSPQHACCRKMAGHCGKTAQNDHGKACQNLKDNPIVASAAETLTHPAPSASFLLQPGLPVAQVALPFRPGSPVVAESPPPCTPQIVVLASRSLRSPPSSQSL